MSWQYQGAMVGHYHRPLHKAGYCYIISDKGKLFLIPVDRVKAD